MMIEGFMDTMANYMYGKATEILVSPEHYNMICIQPDNKKYKTIFTKELFLLLSANIIYIMTSYLNKRDKIRTIQGCLYVSYADKVLKKDDSESDGINEAEMKLYLKRLYEYFDILYISNRGVAELERYPKVLFECRKLFLNRLNESCDPYCDMYTDLYSPIIASVLFNSCRFAYEKLEELNVQFYS